MLQSISYDEPKTRQIAQQDKVKYYLNNSVNKTETTK